MYAGSRDMATPWVRSETLKHHRLHRIAAAISATIFSRVGDPSAASRFRQTRNVAMVSLLTGSFCLPPERHLALHWDAQVLSSRSVIMPVVGGLHLILGRAFYGRNWKHCAAAAPDFSFGFVCGARPWCVACLFKKAVRSARKQSKIMWRSEYPKCIQSSQCGRLTAERCPLTRERELDLRCEPVAGGLSTLQGSSA